MFEVKWGTGVGYGDFVTGLGYAHGSAIKYETPVHIEFHWNHSKEHMFSPLDPETIVERCDYIYSIMSKLPQVSVSHQFNANPNFRFYNQLDEFNPMHGLWYTDMPDQTKKKHVAIWTTDFNISFPGHWKDPVNKRWNDIRAKLSDYVVEEITYRTPVKEAIEIINKCEFGIGYDGLAHQLFKFMWKPLFVFCDRKWLNNILVPQAILLSNADEFIDNRVDTLLVDAKAKVDLIRLKHQKYLSEKMKADEHPLFNTFIYRQSSNRS
jgi:hypothetical protein